MKLPNPLPDDEYSIPQLTEALAAPNVTVRRQAAGKLGELGDAQVVEPLLEALKREAVAAYGAPPMEPENLLAIRPWLNSLREQTIGVKVAIIRALGKIGDKGAVEPLIEILGDEVTTTEQVTVTMYLRAIGRVSLLSADEEIALAIGMRKGKQAQERLAQVGTLSSDEIEISKLQFEEARGRASRHRLILSNLRLVVSVARKYAGRGIPLLDLIQEGNFGLLRAVDRFDYRKGHGFSTYATGWIKWAITRAFVNSAELRTNAIAALGEIGDKRAVPVLERLQEHDFGKTSSGIKVKDAAAEAIKRIREQ